MSELESSLPPSAFSGTDESSLAMQLPTIVAHMHDYFVHVAARMEQLHNEVGLRWGQGFGRLRLARV